MSTIVPDPTSAIAARLRIEREMRGWAIGELAERSGVSRAMISKVERAEASPTAMLLGRLSGAFGLTVSALLSRAEGTASRIARMHEQPVWQDPETGYVRRAVSPATGSPLELVHIDLPVGARVEYPAAAYVFIHQQIWVLRGILVLQSGDEEHRLSKGDCLQLGAPADCVFSNPGPGACVYLVALVRR